MQTVSKESSVKKLPGFGRSGAAAPLLFCIKDIPGCKSERMAGHVVVLKGSGGFVRKCALLSKQRRLSAIA